MKDPRSTRPLRDPRTTGFEAQDALVAGGAGEAPDPRGEFVRQHGEDWYRIRAFDRMPPCLMNVPTDTDLWMFISSAGGLTAGRRDPAGAPVAYDAVDRLHD